MQLSLLRSLAPGLFHSYSDRDKQYYLLFSDSLPNNTKGPFFVKTSDLIVETCLFHIGDLHLHSYEGKVVGTIFYSQSPSFSIGSFCLAHTGIIKNLVDTKSVSYFKDMDVGLSLKTKEFVVYTKKNAMTLVVTPNFSKAIRENLEA